VTGTGIAGQFVDAIHPHTTQRAVAVTAPTATRRLPPAREHGIATLHPTMVAPVNDP
jgi:hypothetical protein